MENMDVIDRFLATFLSYIDSGFGLLAGDVAYLTSSLIVIDITLAGLFWALSQNADIISGLLKKTLYVGFFAFVLGNFGLLSDILFASFSTLGIKAGSSTLTTDDLMRPGYIAGVGFEAAQPLLEAVGDMLGPIAFFENFVPISVMLVAWVIILIAFFVLALQLFITILEFKLTTLAGFVLVPFALWNRTAFLAERVLGNVITSGIKLMVLAVIIGIGSTLFVTVTDAFRTAKDPTLSEVMSTVLAATVFLWMGVFGPGIASGLVSGAPQLGGGSMAGTATAIGAGAVLTGSVAARGVSSGVKAGASLAGGTRTAWDLGRLAPASTGWRGSLAGATGVMGASTAALQALAGKPFSGIAAAYRRGGASVFEATGGTQTPRTGPEPDRTQPPWAKRLARRQQLHQAGTLAVHVLHDGDRGMTSATPSLQPDDD